MGKPHPKPKIIIITRMDLPNDKATEATKAVRVSPLVDSLTTHINKWVKSQDHSSQKYRPCRQSNTIIASHKPI